MTDQGENFDWTYSCYWLPSFVDYYPKTDYGLLSGVLIILDFLDPEREYGQTWLQTTESAPSVAQLLWISGP